MVLDPRLTNRLALRHPRAGIALAGWLGYRFGSAYGRPHRPSAKAVRAVFGDLADREVARIRREAASLELRNQALNALFQAQGLSPLLPLIEVDPGPLFGLLQEKTPVVVVAWHMGPQRHLMATLRKLEIDALVAGAKARSLRAASGRLKVVSLEDTGLGTGFLRLALETLGRGGVVGLAMDGSQGGRHAVDFLGRKLEIGRGVAALVRRTGAELVPLTARWIGRSSRIEARLHAPLPKPAIDPRQALPFDSEILATTARWFEEHARRDPGNVRLRRLRKASSEPRP
jgi:lauroyl/myristoyl acyltransferase